MLRARLTNGVFILGLDAENIRQLKEGQSILVSLAEMGGTDDVAIIFGETLEDIKAELEANQGEPLPDPISLDKARKIQ